MGFLGRKLSKRSLVGHSKETKYEPPNALSTLGEILEDNQQIASGQDDIIREQQRDIDAMKEEEKALQTQVWALSDQLNKSKTEADTFRTLNATLGEQRRILDWQIQTAKSNIYALNTSGHQKDQELSSRANAITFLSGKNQELQSRISGLEKVIATASNESGQNLQGLFDHYSKLEMAHDKMAPKLQAAEDSRSKLSEDLEVMKSENASLKTVIDELHQEASSMIICQPRTLRSFLTMRLAEYGSDVQQPDDTTATVDHAQIGVSHGIPEDSLDKPCSPNELQSFARLLPTGEGNNQGYEHLQLVPCTVCSKQKFFATPSRNPRHNQSSVWPNEYLGQSRYFPCCYNRVCKKCFTKHLLDTLEFKWWCRLGSLQWFPCPRVGCNESLGISCEGDFQICLERNCQMESGEYAKMYIKAVALRQVLENLDPIPADDILKRAAELSRHLITTNRMHSPFDSRFDPTVADETGCIPDFNPGTIVEAIMDVDPSPLPLFVRFLRRRSTPQTCMVCSKTLYDVDYENVDAWKSTCKGFEGSWMWNILSFPTREIQQCDHEFGVCRACTAEHLRSTIITGGPSACENLSCPQCRRKLSYEEIHRLADPDTIARYEKFLLHTFLSNEPNFRWCLSPTCNNGQLYQTTPNDQKITCGECNFKMCFNHQVPWHRDLTCAQYDSQKSHGDPGFAETQEWIKTNTKPCPGCQVGIQKGEACFHMTCSQCGYEFCWQCLGDYREIRSRGQRGHREDCFFRTNNVGPTGLRGENLNEALRARRNSEGGVRPRIRVIPRR